MKKTVCLITALLLCVLCSFAAADQKVTLPGGTHTVKLPDSLQKSDGGGGSLLYYYTGNALQMHVFCFDNGGTSLDGYAGIMTSAGKDATVRTIGGTQMICYRDTDASDGASLIAYIYPVEDEYVEIDFFCGSRKAEDTVTAIMNSFR